METSLDIMRSVLETESQAIVTAMGRLNQETADQIKQLFESLMANSGQLVFCGVGKSGSIAVKLASTFCSLGLPSFYLHPVEALHGDLGRVRENDALVFLSKSGHTLEILNLLPFIKLPKSRRIGILGNTSSPMAEACEIVLDGSVEKEACLNDQAPTTSSTLALALGDAMAVLFEKVAGVTKEKYALNHPGGILGKTLWLKVQDLMVPADQCPRLGPEDSFKKAVAEMTQFNVGQCAILDDQNQLQGILMESDFRRYLFQEKNDFAIPVKNLMNSKPFTLFADMMAIEALEQMEGHEKKFYVAPVLKDGKFQGMLRLHDLFGQGLSSSRKN